MKLAELFEATTIRKWLNQARKDHGDVTKHELHDGRVVAKRGEQIVGVYNRKNGAAVVYPPKKVDEDWRALAAAGALAAAAPSQAAIPIHVIPHATAKAQSSSSDVIEINGREYVRRDLPLNPNDMKKVRITTTDDGRPVYVWTTVAGTRRQHVYWYWAPIK